MYQISFMIKIIPCLIPEASYKNAFFEVVYHGATPPSRCTLQSPPPRPMPLSICDLVSHRHHFMDNDDLLNAYILPQNIGYDTFSYETTKKMSHSFQKKSLIIIT